MRRGRECSGRDRGREAWCAAWHAGLSTGGWEEDSARETRVSEPQVMFFVGKGFLRRAKRGSLRSALRITGGLMVGVISSSNTPAFGPPGRRRFAFIRADSGWSKLRMPVNGQSGVW